MKRRAARTKIQAAIVLRLAVGVVVSALSACAGMPAMLTPVSAPAQSDNTDLEAVLGALNPQRLKKGECGMFLWSRTEDRKLLLFSNSKEPEAIVMLNDREQTIPRVSGEGAVILGYNEQQSYVWRNLFIQVTVTFERPAGIGQGAVIPNGTIRMSRRDGWEYVLPVGGLIACEK